MDDLANKTIMVTGASSGIGRATCRGLSSHGANIIMLSRNESAMQELQNTLPTGTTAAFQCDLLEPDKLCDVIDAAWKWNGQIDGLAYCAGLGGYVRLRNTSPTFMFQRMQVNCISFVEMVRQIVKKKMKSQIFRSVAVSSLVSSGHYKYYVAYAASKAALEAAVKAMSAELINRNVTINAIQPGFVNTPMITSLNEVIDIDKEIKNRGYQPLGLIDPDEVAQFIAFLLNPRFISITGGVFPISGGAPC